MLLSKQIKKGLMTLALALASTACAANPDVVVVVAANSPLASMSNHQVADIFLGKNSRLPNGQKAVPLDQIEGSHLRDEFYQKLVDKSPAQLKSHWSKIIFTGRGRPPKEMHNDSAIKRAIANNPNAIGYIDDSAVDGSVKVILQLK